MIQPLIALETFGSTNVGKVRKNNEDCYIAQYIWDNQFLLCAAIDGMGGYEGGEVAADIARFTLINDLESFQGDDVFAALKQAFVNANNEIVRYSQESPQYASMGCVATVGLFDIIGRKLYVVHVGDSRLYRFQEGVLQKLSHDHSVVGYREEIGDLTEEEAMKHPQRSVISRSVGNDMHSVDDEGFLETSIFPLLTDAEYLFCSDGLSDMLRSDEICEILDNDSFATQDKVERLIEAANEAGGKDNITVVLTRIQQSHSRPQNHSAFEPQVAVDTPCDEKKKRSYKLPIIIVAIIAALVAIACLIVLHFMPEKLEESEPTVTEVTEESLSESHDESEISESTTAETKVETEHSQPEIVAGQ